MEVADLKFENEIEEVKYDQLTTDQFTPIIPEPIKFISKKDFVEINDKTFKLVNDSNISKNTMQYTDKLGIVFSSNNGFPIHFIDSDYKEDEYSLEISKDKIQIFHKNYGGKLMELLH